MVQPKLSVLAIFRKRSLSVDSWGWESEVVLRLDVTPTSQILRGVLNVRGQPLALSV
jgi:hypothetical protein